ncbi:MAG: 2-oxo acid dehydrogenase subunit E2 [Candidatus Hodarchaeales archaeon]|jgi:pyruvate/2-oxoglutarate dehydrogenase complex dihydrolipoamide acyltransferase (E2) component
MNDIGEYSIKDFPRNRLGIVDYLDEAQKRHIITGLFEVDITKAREVIKKSKNENGTKISFTGWICWCIGQIIENKKEIHAARKGRKKLVIFEDVDISVQIERLVKGKKIPLPYVLRKVNHKSVLEITQEIRSVQNQTFDDQDIQVLGNRRRLRFMARIGINFPKFIRALFWKRVVWNPFTMKKVSGLISVTSVGMYGNHLGWAIPLSGFPISIAIGGIGKKPGIVNDTILIREYLALTLQFDHDIIDGAPATRFSADLIDYLETAKGLGMQNTQ